MLGGGVGNKETDRNSRCRVDGLRDGLKVNGTRAGRARRATVVPRHIRRRVGAEGASEEIHLALQ